VSERGPESKGEAESGPAGWSRRGVVAALAGGALAIPLGAWWLRQPPAEPPPVPDTRPPEQISLEAFLDTILPSGEFPGHRETGVAGVLWSVAERNQAMKSKLQEGAELLDLEAKGSFVALPAPERARVVRALAAAGREDPGHRYYALLRDQAMRLHYTHPLARARLGFDQAPQPRGYASYTEAPSGA